MVIEGVEGAREAIEAGIAAAKERAGMKQAPQPGVSGIREGA
jgi:hypothetical protein